ncbi:hypothetical protein [Telmatospirillum sp.]|uniref:hypothetical protein n=1 Tax=Telmatospirillum sp. TaxID=2079197 RepID=UPI00284F62D6|nr:hypothetical protein [Telmatospirillum sp.]MDR3437924.1 hypothetical protein [Telmatospirillum sp.]
MAETGQSSHGEETSRLLGRISEEPAYRSVLYKILTFCRTTRSSVEIEATVISFPEMKSALHPPRLLLSWLVAAGGIESIAPNDAEPGWRTTAAGRSVLEIENPSIRLCRLLDAEPAYRDVYRLVLQSCLAPKTRPEIESVLDGNPLLETPKLYPSFFIERLESAGGLEWDQKWRTTEAGEMFVREGGGQSESKNFPHRF